MTLSERIRNAERELAELGGASTLAPPVLSGIIITHAIDLATRRIVEAIEEGLQEIATEIKVQGGQ